MKNKIQIVSINVPSAGAIVNIDTETDIKHIDVKGLYISSSEDLNRSSIKLSIDGNEVLPKNFEVKLLQPTNALTYKDVAMPVEEKAKGSKIKGEYVDGSLTGLTYPYTVNIYLLNVE